MNDSTSSNMCITEIPNEKQVNIVEVLILVLQFLKKYGLIRSFNTLISEAGERWDIKMPLEEVRDLDSILSEYLYLVERNMDTMKLVHHKNIGNDIRDNVSKTIANLGQLLEDYYHTRNFLIKKLKSDELTHSSLQDKRKPLEPTSNIKNDDQKNQNNQASNSSFIKKKTVEENNLNPSLFSNDDSIFSPMLSLMDSKFLPTANNSIDNLNHEKYSSKDQSLSLSISSSIAKAGQKLKKRDQKKSKLSNSSVHLPKLTQNLILPRDDTPGNVIENPELTNMSFDLSKPSLYPDISDSFMNTIGQSENSLVGFQVNRPSSYSLADPDISLGPMLNDSASSKMNKQNINLEKNIKNQVKLDEKNISKSPGKINHFPSHLSSNISKNALKSVPTIMNPSIQKNGHINSSLSKNNVNIKKDKRRRIVPTVISTHISTRKDSNNASLYSSNRNSKNISNSSSRLYQLSPKNSKKNETNTDIHMGTSNSLDSFLNIIHAPNT